MKVPANLVPAAAVIRGGQALFNLTGRKASVGGKFRYSVNMKVGLSETGKTYFARVIERIVEFLK